MLTRPCYCASISTRALQAEEESGQRRTRPAAGQDLTVAGALHTPPPARQGPYRTTAPQAEDSRLQSIRLSVVSG